MAACSDLALSGLNPRGLPVRMTAGGFGSEMCSPFKQAPTPNLNLNPLSSFLPPLHSHEREVIFPLIPRDCLAGR